MLEMRSTSLPTPLRTCSGEGNSGLVAKHPSHSRNPGPRRIALLLAGRVRKKATHVLQVSRQCQTGTHNPNELRIASPWHLYKISPLVRSDPRRGLRFEVRLER